MKDKIPRSLIIKLLYLNYSLASIKLLIKRLPNLKIKRRFGQRLGCSWFVVRGAWVCDDTTDDYVDECLKQ